MKHSTELLDPRNHDLAVLRGLPSADDLTPISAAVVIGIGGSGIQTISRLRASILASRPDQAAISQVQFVGIDSVRSGFQKPALPENVSLGPGEYVNLTEAGFDPAKEVKFGLGNDEQLAAFWQPNYQPPSGHATLGLKHERMLGHLAFHKSRGPITSLIHRAINRALALSGAIGKGGQAPVGFQIPVVVVNSCAGGTGSSGFLEVVHAIWEASSSYNLRPEIRAFTFLPDVFETAVAAGPLGPAAAEAQKSNAYAYFRELDHFLTSPQNLSEMLGLPVPTTLDEGELLKQVTLLGSMLGSQGSVIRIPDIYEITAEALYHMLMTNLGRPLITVDGVNVDRALQTRDLWGKPRPYCSLGVARVVYPRTTLEFHLYNRYVHLLLREGFLARPSDLESTVRSDEVTRSLSETIRGFDAEVRSIEPDEDITRLLLLSQLTLEALELRPEASEAQERVNDVKTLSLPVRRSVERLCRERSVELTAELEEKVISGVFDTGQGVPFAEEAIRQLAQAARSRLADVQNSAGVSAKGRTSAELSVEEQMKKLRVANARKLHEQLFAQIEGLLGRGATEADIATDLGSAIQGWVDAIYNGERLRAAERALSGVVELLDRLLRELGNAQGLLNQMASDARTLWEGDELKGKDAGPLATTTFVPHDVIPEVDYCQLAVDAFEEVLSENRDHLNGDRLAELVRRWRAEAGNRGIFSLGADSNNERRRAEDTLTKVIISEGRLRALEKDGEPRLPRSLAEVSDATTLSHAIQGLHSLSREVLWTWIPSKYQSEGTDTTHSVVSTSIAHPQSLSEPIHAVVGSPDESVITSDEEQAVALSVEWAVPIHALTQIPVWRRRYETTLAASLDDPAKNPPPHIDKRFAKELDELVPKYFAVETAAELAAVALVFSNVYRAEFSGGSGPIVAAFDQTRRAPAAPMVGLSSDARWILADIELENDRFKVDGDPTSLEDASYEKLVAHFGSDPSSRHLAQSVRTWLAANYGFGGLAGHVDDFAESLEPAIDAAKGNPSEIETLRLLLDELSDWQAELGRMALRVE